MFMMEGIDESFDAAVYVGYHARAGTPNGVLDHTSSGNVTDVSINGIIVTTDSNGVFSLSGVNPGEYFLSLPTIPQEWAPTSETIFVDCDQTVWVDLFYDSCVPAPTPAPAVLPETGRAGPAPASVFLFILAGAAVLGLGITLLIRQR